MLFFLFVICAAWCIARTVRPVFVSLALGLSIGGAFANYLEYERHGKVYDFIPWVKAKMISDPEIANFADYAIVLGHAMLIYLILFS